MALPSRRPRKRRSLTASAYRIGDPEAEDYARRKALPWQARSLETVTLVPELNFASRFYARMLKQVRVYPAMRNERDERTEIKSGLPLEVLNRIQDPGGGRSQLLWSYGRLMFITGEGLMFGKNLNTEMEAWSFVWNGEIEVETHADGSVRKITQLLGGGEKREYTPEEAVCYRMWTPSPMRSNEAESPLQSALEIAEELIILTKAVRATSVSRLINGLLFLPSEISPPPEDAGSDEDALGDPWHADFIQHAITQIENPGTAEAASPLISWVSGEYIEKIRWIQIHDPQTDYMERDLRIEAINRLAYGMDMPPEALKGLGDSNHWAAMQILGDMWKSHGAPMAQQFCNEISAAYLQPALREAGFADWHMVVADYDAAQVVVKPDRSDDADKAAELVMIGPRGYRLMKNIPEDYAPSETEREDMLEVLGRKPEEDAPDEPRGDAAAEEGPPAPGPEGDSGRQTRVVTSSASEAMGAAMMALARCRELAGIRVRQKEKLCPECLQPAAGKPASLVASVLGPATLAQLDLDPLRLVRGGADTLKAVLMQWGYSDLQSGAICEMIEGFAARTLYDSRQPQLPTGFSAHLERARENGSALEN